MSRTASQQVTRRDLHAHELRDSERFDAIDLRNRRMEDKIDQLPTKEDMQPIIDVYLTIKNGRNGIMWMAALIVTVGAAVMAIKGMFK